MAVITVTAQATHGGRREGAGRKPTVNSKKITLWLDDDTLRILETVETRYDMNRSEADRFLVKRGWQCLD